MFPNATRGYMPFVSGNENAANKSPKKIKKPKKKTYQVTLRDKNGFIYTYLIKTDGTQSLPELLDSKISGTSRGANRTRSLPNIGMRSPTRIQRNINREREEDNEDDKKGGLLSSFIRFLKQKTGKGGKSKRKAKPMAQRKRIRTVSAMSNLDPIQESPEEDNDDDNNDDDSYTHSDSSCDSASEASFGDSINDSASIKSIKSSEANEDVDVITNEP